MIKRKLKYADIIIVFAVSVFLWSQALIPVCKRAADLAFDLEHYLTWEWLTFSGVKPFDGIFTPYGILPYLMTASSAAYLLLVGVFAVEVTGLYWVFKKIWGNSFLAFITWMGLWLLISPTDSLDVRVFPRYLWLLSWSAIWPVIFYLYGKQQRFLPFLMGVINGALMVLLTDQSLYTIGFSLLLLPTLELLKLPRQNLRQLTTAIIFKLFFFGLGLMGGFLPFLIWLNKQNTVMFFWQQFKDFSLTAGYGKLLFTYQRNWGHGIVFAALAMTLLSLWWVKIKGKPFTVAYWVLVGTGLALLLMENKNLLRHTAYFLVPYSYVMLASFAAEIKNKKHSWIGVLVVSGIVLLYIPLNVNKRMNALAGLVKNVNFENRLCSQADFEKTSQAMTVGAYQEVTQLLSGTEASTSSSMLVYPYDPSLYVMLHQTKVPYFLTAYEGAARPFEQRTIDYLDKEAIKYVIYHPTAGKIDSISEFIHTPLVMKYILTHYQLERGRENYFLFSRRNEPGDFFNQRTIQSQPDLIKYLTWFDMGSIPASEGYHKLDAAGGRWFLEPTDIEKINQMWKKSAFNTEGKVIAVRFEEQLESKGQVRIRLTTDKGLPITVGFTGYPEHQDYVINLERIPGFYTPKLLTGLEADTEGIKVGFMGVDGIKDLW